MMSKWCVSRQSYWGVEPEDQYCVEIAYGGIDYANADMLVSKYDGEGQEYSDPREAVVKALEIRDQWQKDKPEFIINIAHGFTGGNTMPFEGDEDEALKTWAEKRYQELPKCDECGTLIDEKEHYTLTAYPDDGKFCSEHCCEKRMACS